MSQTPTNDRPLRADARRNVERVLTAARDVFSESGYATSVTEVARRSGLGIGTVYRHFPSKTVLIDSVAIAVMRDLLVTVEEALQSDEDPWDAFRRVFRLMGAVRSSEIFSASGGRTSPPSPELVAARSALLRRLGVLVERAQESGRMRTDVNVNDVVIVLNAVPPRSAIAARDGGVDHSERHLGLLLDGLRAPAGEAFTSPAPTPRDVDRFFRSTHDL